MTGACTSPAVGPVQRGIEKKLTDRLAPSYLEIHNESHLHSVPPGSEYHFKVVVVIDDFASQATLTRHRTINHLLAEELNSGVHALSISAFTPAEWTDRGGAVEASPKCRGGMSKES